ncbi:MAG: HEAT repeat domain-containing protein [Planctomycetes bacterium]|nr:HEAT repeat domain-containing protein [Planctomycetota bacterium]
MQPRKLHLRFFLPACIIASLFAMPSCQDRSRGASTKDPADDGTAATNLTRLQSQNASVRKQAADKLGELKAPAAVDSLIKALADRDKIVRYSAAEALGNIADSRAIEPLGKALYDNESLVRLEATKALAKFKDKKTLDFLIYATKGYDYQVKYAAAKGLFDIPDPKSVGPLIALLGDDIDADVIVASAEALGEIGSAQAVEPLRKLVENKNGSVRQAAGKAIAKIEKSSSR